MKHAVLVSFFEETEELCVPVTRKPPRSLCTGLEETQKTTSQMRGWGKISTILLPTWKIKTEGPWTMPGYLPKEYKTQIYANPFSTLKTIAKGLTQSKYPPTYVQIKKRWYLHPVECYSVMKKMISCHLQEQIEGLRE